MTRQLVRNFNSSLSFNGTSNTVTTTLPANFTGAKTFTAWIFRANNSGNHAIMGGTGGNNLIIRCSTANDLMFWADGGYSVVTWGNCIPLRKWTQVAIVYDLSNASLYINGVLISTQAYTQAWTVFTGSFTFGSRFATDFWAGGLDDIRVYNAALTAAQVASLYYTGLDPVTPLAKWLLNEGAGTTATDTSGNGYTGTITGATYSTNVPMKPRPLNINTKNSLYFDGSSYVTVPNKFADSLTGYTISYWVKASDFSKAQYHTYNGLRGGLYPRTYQNTDKTVQIQYRINGVTKSAASSSSQVIPSGTWNFVVATIDVTSGGKIYLNGNLAGVNTDTGTYIDSGTSGSPLIGGDNASNNFTGNMTNVRAWNRALTQDEITNLYLNKVVPQAGLTSEYLLDEGVGSTTADTSGSNNNGTITGALWSLDTPSRARLMNRDMKSSLSFAGAGYAQLPAIPTTTGLSISAWVKTSTPNPVSAIDIMGRSAGTSDVFEITGNGEVRLNVATSGGACNVLSRTSITLKNTWFHVAGTYNITTGVGNVYVNGVIVGTTTGGSGTFSNNASTWLLGALTTVTRNFTGNIVDVRMFDGALTAAQVLNIYQGNSEITTSPTLVAKYLLNEGAGTPIDTSGNSKNATSISSATYVLDTPFYKRQAVNPNLVKNGDFEYVPPFTAVTTGSGRWIDGTAAGSTTNSNFNWAITQGTTAGSWSARFDTTEKNSGNSSIKLSTTAIGSALDISRGTALSTALNLIYGISVLPSTSYSYSFFMKTNLISGSSGSGARMNFNERDAVNGSSVNNFSQSVVTTTGWTQYSGTFTTASTTRVVIPRCVVKGNDGAGTMIMDAWFDDIILKPTTATTRLTA